MNEPDPQQLRWPLAYRGRHSKPDRSAYAWWLVDLAFAYGVIRLTSGR